MFDIYYNGLFGKRLITTVDDADTASNMCFEHNKKLSPTEMEAQVGNMFFKKRKNMDENLETVWKQYLTEESKSNGWTKERTEDDQNIVN